MLALATTAMTTLASVTALQTLANASGLISGRYYKVGAALYYALSASVFMIMPTSWTDAAGGAPRTVTGTTTETTVFSTTIPTEFFHANVSLWINPLWSYTNSANNKIIRVRAGGVIIHQATATTTTHWYRPTILQWRNSLTAQTARSLGDTSVFGNSNNALVNTTIDPSAGVPIEVSLQLGLGTETATLEFVKIRVE